MKSDLPERSFELAKRVVRLRRFLEDLPARCAQAGKPGVWRMPANQLLRSGASIGENIEEGRRRK